MAPHPKVHLAFTATRALGIPDEEVKPVLKRLLKLYGNWEFIEADNFRTLIDTYYENKRAEGPETGNGSGAARGINDSGRQAKRSRLEEPRIEAGSTESISVSPSDEHNGVPLSREIIKLPGPRMNGSNRCLLPGDRSKSNNLHNRPIKQEKPEWESSSSVSRNVREGAASTANLRVSAVTNRVSSSVSPNSKIRPLRENVNYRKSSVTSDGSGSSESEFVIASSTSAAGEVKLYLNCRSANDRQNFQIPKLDRVLRCVEDKYIQTYKTTGASFSVAKIMKDICQSYLRLGNDCSRSTFGVGSSTGTVNSVGGPIKRQMITNGSKTANGSTSDVNGARQGLQICEKQQNIGDITKGSENVKISLLDEIGNEKLPIFNYIPHNIIYQNARLQFSLARISDEDCCSGCSGDCLSSELPCACSHETGGEFAYTPNGHLKDSFLEACTSMKKDPQEQHFVYCEDCPVERTKNEDMPEKCKGHLLRKFIKECWRTCGCDMQCGNRVVQRGIKCNLQVFVTEGGKGWGVRTLDDLPKGTFVCEYIGEILTNTELYERNLQNTGSKRHTYPVTLDADWGSESNLQDEDALCLDATYHGNVARFVNHRCFDSNLIDIPIQIETPDRHYYHLAFFTTRRVRPYEELTWDYGIDFDDVDHPIKAFKCCCGSEFCRDKTRKGKGKAKANLKQ